MLGVSRGGRYFSDPASPPSSLAVERLCSASPIRPTAGTVICQGLIAFVW